MWSERYHSISPHWIPVSLSGYTGISFRSCGISFPIFDAQIDIDNPIPLLNDIHVESSYFTVEGLKNLWWAIIYTYIYTVSMALNHANIHLPLDYDKLYIYYNILYIYIYIYMYPMVNHGISHVFTYPSWHIPRPHRPRRPRRRRRRRRHRHWRRGRRLGETKRNPMEIYPLVMSK